MEGLGAGLAAIAFWGFLTAVVVGGMWYALRERQAQYDTLSRMVESGQPVDEAVVERVLGGNKRMDRDLKVAGLIVVFVAPGLAVFGWIIGKVSENAFLPMMGVAALVGFIGAGLLVAARYAERSYRDDNTTALNRTMAP